MARRKSPAKASTTPTKNQPNLMSLWGSASPKKVMKKSAAAKDDEEKTKCGTSPKKKALKKAKAKVEEVEEEKKCMDEPTSATHDGGEIKAPFDVGTIVKKREGKSKVLSSTQTFSSYEIKNVSPTKQTYTVQLLSSTKKEQWNHTQIAWGVHLASFVNQKIAKKFKKELYFGTVVDAIRENEDSDDGLYRIVYEDGDEEDFDEEELEDAMKLYSSQSHEEEKNGKKRGKSGVGGVANKRSRVEKDDAVKKEKDTAAMTTPVKEEKKGKTPRRTSSRKRTQITSYFSPQADDDYDYDESSEEEKPKPKPKLKARKQPTSKASASKRKRIIESSDSEFDHADNDLSDDDDDLSDMEEEDDDDDDDDFMQKEKSAPKSKKAKKASSTKKQPPKKEAPSKKKKGSETLEDLKRKNYNNVKPQNNPQALPKEGPYVEPVGIDATDGIVEGIIGGMVRKIGKLLQSSIKFKKKEMGELTFPIKLQTACSGTDAPSIALGLVKESLDRLQMQSSEEAFEHGFEYTHEMSCEIEPFKQAYIGRNFPGVLLFPDITKLTEAETVVDVYGRAQTIPAGNLFVAGTSCKDFSMLKSSNRKDIEDKGTSGETFLAAVEFLEQEKPPVAIFENVDNAPWDKMQEYIRGRINLGERNVDKNIGGKGADADNQLKFSVNEDGRYVAEAVPRQVGIRAGCIVQGLVRGDDDPNNVRPLKSKKSSKGKILTLKQLAKEHDIDLEEDTLVMEKKARYCTHLIKLDTKVYGLPQTRNRKYLFIWRSDDPQDNLGEYFQQIMEHLQTPLLHSMEAFLLPPTHDRIRCFREALRSGPGLMVARERAKELDFWDYDLSGVKDLALHLVYREKNGIEERSRWLTNWNTRGRKKVAPGLWPELVAMWNMRRCDLIDSFAASAMRDNFSRDALHHNFSWDLSQNVNRATVRSATVGVSGCVTPGGELLLPHKGRTMMGYEKLLLQGIPFSRLLLGPETEVQLSDLAGNAMSVPVVCATMLAAICAPQLRREDVKNKKMDLSGFRISQKYDSANGAVLAERGDLQERSLNPKDFSDVFSDIANELAHDAYLCSVLCNCESSGQTARDDKILECSNCGLGICHTCSSLHQIEGHELKEIITEGSDKKRVDSHVFEMKLRCAVPSVLRLGEGWEDTIKDCEGLESYSFQLQQVDRKRGHWLLTYGAWEDHGSGRQVAEIRVTLGQIGTLDKDLGLGAYVKCFAPSIRHNKPQRGILRDSARLVMKMNGGRIKKGASQWEITAKSTKSSLKLVGSDACPSQRVQIGLGDMAAQELKKHKPQNKFIPKIQSRNNVLHYHPKWKTWPGTIEVSGDETDTVNGTYHRMSCQHTVVLSALWRRDKTKKSPALYIYIRPDVLRTGVDVAVIAQTPSYRDQMEICELMDWIPENTLVERTHKTQATFLNWKSSNLTLEVPKPTMVMERGTKSFHKQISSRTTDSDPPVADPPVVCEMGGLTKEVIQSLLQHSSNMDDDEYTSIDLVGKSGTKNAKRLSIVAAPSLLKFAAEGKLPLQLSQWYKLSHPKECSFGLCEKNFPSRPVEKWKEETKGRKGSVYVREYDAEESNDYYHNLFQRPNAFQVNVDRTSGKLVVHMNPFVAAHQAAAYLVRGRGLGDTYAKTLDVDYCLSELSSMGEPITKEFQVPNSDIYKEASIEGLELPLYKRQAKALTRMQAIENGEVEFLEEERSEHVLNGIGWCLIARAKKKSKLKGGVLGDAIGSGKTVVTIALILSGIEKARKNRSIADGRSGATLIVVPPGLVKQWDDERKKFTKDSLKCITIDCTNTLKRYSLRELCSADIVIVPAGIIEERLKTATSRPYTEHLSKKAGAGKIPPAPSSFSQREAPSIEGTWVRNMSSGPTIYVGNDGKQRTRDEQAYYGHCYYEAIKKLREKKFGASERGVPLEYFTWERIVIDECHESLVTSSKHEPKADDFKAQARRGAREFLGVSHTDASSRPLIAATAVWGLTGTPLLETEARVTELANLMGGTYLTGSAHHWRKEERESGRDLFLNQQEGSKSREYRCAVQESCHTYVREACQRNRGAKLEVNLERKQKIVNMSASEGADFLKSIKETNIDNFIVKPDQLGDKASNVLTVTASSTARHSALFEIIDSIQSEEPDTKIIIFANAFYGGYKSALSALESFKRKFSHVSENHSVQEQNEIISWFRHEDATEEDQSHPRILLLSFEQAAGHNLQEACHHVIMYDPMYSGSDAVADASVEEQALGRVMRQGQKYDVTVTRIVVRGPKGERCLDDSIVERNLDEDVLRAATSNFE